MHTYLENKIIFNMLHTGGVLVSIIFAPIFGSLVAIVVVVVVAVTIFLCYKVVRK